MRYIVIFLTFAANLFAETYEFSSAKWGATVVEVREALEHKFALEPTDVDGDIPISGLIGGNVFTGFLVFEDYGLSMVNLVFYDEQNDEETFSWLKAKVCYSTLANALERKYGVPYVAEFFTEPYYEGDGYEIQAIGEGNCVWQRAWPKEGDSENISLGVTSDGFVMITYMSDMCIAEVLRQNAQSIDEL